MRAFQYSTYNRMLKQDYDGFLPISQLKVCQHGIGTLHALEGDFVLWRGVPYHCSLGKIIPFKEHLKIAWSCCHSFESPKKLHCSVSLDTIEKDVINEEFSESFVGMVIECVFDLLKLTSTPKQEKPYPTIDNVISQSESYYFSNIEGVIVGYYVSQELSYIQNPGFHFHFISKDLSIGGHVLDFFSESSQKITFEKITRLELEF